MRVFVLGSTGMLGKYVYLYFKQQTFDVIGVTRSELDAYDCTFDDLSRLGIYEGDVVINCMGVIRQRQGTDPVVFIKVNSIFPYLLQAFCDGRGANLIHISTDCVYSGKRGSYTEDDLHDASDVYGRSKSLGESPGITIVRTSIIGEELYNKKSLIEWVKSQEGKVVDGYTNHIWNGITCLQFAKVCEKIIEMDLFWLGVKHIFSPQKVDKASLVKLISAVYDLNVEVLPVVKGEVCDRSLASVRKVPQFNFEEFIPSLEDQLAELRRFKLT